MNPEPPWRRGIRHLTILWRMQPYRLPSIRSEPAGHTNNRIHRLLSTIASDNGHAWAEHHLLEGSGTSMVLVTASTVRT